MFSDFGKLRLIISAHTNYLFYTFKKLPFLKKDAQYTSKNVVLK